MKKPNSSVTTFAVSLGFAAAVAVLGSCASMSLRTADIDPEAEAILEKASSTLRAAESLRFRVRRDVPAQIADAAGMKRKTDIRVSAVRPDKVYAVTGSGSSQRRFFYDGDSITVYDASVNAYARSAAPSTIDGMIAFLASEWSVRPPMAGLLKSHPFSGAAVRRVSSGKFAGRERISGEPCHRLTLTGEGVVWDLWFSENDHLMRRFDVTVTELEGSPRGVMLVSDWDLNAGIPGETFEARVPRSAKLFPMTELP